MLTGQREIEQAKVRTYWETGWIISEHLQLNESRPGYGTETMAKLARDLDVSDTVLYRCVRFAESFPILAARPKLTWGHYRLLIPVEDVAQRKALERDAVENAWTTYQLEDHIRPLRLTTAAPAGNGDASPGSVAKLLVPQRGTPGVYRVATINGTTVVDLGFACYLDLTADQAETFKDGDLVSVDASPSTKLRAGGEKIIPADGATKSDLFTYRVEIIKVVDGDTLWVKIYLRPRQWLKQKLRLRGLDCPEMSTPEGKAAKRFVDALVAKTTAVTVNTTKPDKYDRYLADVFMRVTSDVGRVTSDDGEIFLNNALLENGQAARKDAWQFRDWEPELLA